MALVPVQPYVFKDAEFIVEADDFASHASTLAIVPNTTQETVEWQGLTPDATFSETTTPKTSWTFNVTLAQDTSETSLHAYLLEHAGEEKEVTLQPKRGVSQKNYTVTVTIVPPQIGGDVNTVQTAQVSMPVKGDPVPGESPAA